VKLPNRLTSPRARIMAGAAGTQARLPGGQVSSHQHFSQASGNTRPELTALDV
jgi:hypothetical protein